MCVTLLHHYSMSLYNESVESDQPMLVHVILHIHVAQNQLHNVEAGKINSFLTQPEEENIIVETCCTGCKLIKKVLDYL